MTSPASAGSEGDFGETGFTANRDDVLAAARFMDSRGLPPHLFIGHSLGGAAALAAAHEREGLSGAVAIAAPADPVHTGRLFRDKRDEILAVGHAEVEIAGRSFRVSKAFLDDLETQCPDQVAPKLGCPLLIMHSPVDDTVGIENAGQIFARAKHPKSFISLGGAGHLLAAPADAEYVVEMISTWASRYLPGGTEERRAREAAGANGAGGANGAASAGKEEPRSQAMQQETKQAGQGQSEGQEEGAVKVCERAPPGSLAQEVSVRGHNFSAGEPVPIGDDAGPTPYDLLLAGLGACTSMTLRMYAKRKGWPLEGVEVRLAHGRRHATDCEKAEGAPASLEEISRTIHLQGPLDEAQRARLMEIADKCPVHRTLTGELRVRTEAG